VRSVYAAAAVLVAAFGAGVVAFVVRSGPPVIIMGPLPRRRAPALHEHGTGESLPALHAAPAGPVSPAVAEASGASFGERLAAAALERTRHRVKYDPSYRVMPYPGGDVPAGTGVCTDVIVRSYRAAGIDLQVRVHEDMKRNFGAYPKTWGLRAPDPNIDHRRVPNLHVFFARNGKTLPAARDPAGYAPGDVVTWKLPRGLSHIGIVTGRMANSGRPLVVHNIGAGPKAKDILHKWRMTGHFRYPE